LIEFEQSYRELSPEFRRLVSKELFRRGFAKGAALTRQGSFDLLAVSLQGDMVTCCHAQMTWL
jgi:hypothetical protein